MAENLDMEIKTTTRPTGQWLFNPFRYVAGWSALGLGLVAILLSAYIGSFNDAHFDGVLDTHFNKSSPIWVFLAEGAIDWLCMGVILAIGGLVFARSSFRLIDLLGTQALARWPTVITSFAVMIPGFRKYNDYLTHKITNGGSPVVVDNIDTLLFGLVMLVTLLMIIWMVALMYRAYCVSCNIKGPKAIGSFIVSLCIAELVSKLVIWKLLSCS